MSEQRTTPKKEEPKEFDPVQQSKDDTKSPDEKHEAYVKRLETLHNEPQACVTARLTGSATQTKLRFSVALLADKSADVNSNLVGGAASQSKVFTMPGGVPLKVLSVVATVSNGAATAVTPELTIADQSGVVIAARKQTTSIPAGDTGTATFALRLNDDTTSSTTSSGIQFVVYPQQGLWLNIETTGDHPGAYRIPTGFTPAAGNNRQWSIGIQGSQIAIGAVDLLSLIGTTEVAIIAGGTFNVYDDDGNAQLDMPPDGDTTIKLQTGKSFTVLNDAGNPIFRVDENGDLHGLTGKALTFDL